MPTTRMPGRYSYRQRTPVHEPRVRRPAQGMARQAQANPDVYTSVQPRGADQPGHKNHDSLRAIMVFSGIAKNQKTWDRNVSELAFAYNSALHGSTGHSPAYLNYGRELKSPGSLEQEAALPRNDGNFRRVQRLQEALELARVKIAQSFQKQQKNYDLRRRSWTPSNGDKVLKKTQHLSGSNFRPARRQGEVPLARTHQQVETIPRGSRNSAVDERQHIDQSEKTSTPTEATTVAKERHIKMPSSEHASSSEGELAALEATLEAEGFRRLREIGPQYHQVNQQGPTIQRPTQD